MVMTTRAILILMVTLMLGCGNEIVELSTGPGDHMDATSGQCTAAQPQCSNCIDDDGDGLIDGQDPHCTSSRDDRESSFATGISGDNIDAVKQDCFFDGNSGSGDDGCDIHVCCLLAGPCPSELNPQQYDPAACTPSQQCIDACAPLTPPGCDCFGCCTICWGAGCFDVITNPANAPSCDVDVLDDPTLCPPCIRSPVCGTACEPTGCVQCPGQTEADLPPECMGHQCPENLATCSTSSDCAANEFCARGCCIAAVE